MKIIDIEDDNNFILVTHDEEVYYFNDLFQLDYDDYFDGFYVMYDEEGELNQVYGFYGLPYSNTFLHDATKYYRG